MLYQKKKNFLLQDVLNAKKIIVKQKDRKKNVRNRTPKGRSYRIPVVYLIIL